MTINSLSISAVLLPGVPGYALLGRFAQLSQIQRDSFELMMLDWLWGAYVSEQEGGSKVKDPVLAE